MVGSRGQAFERWRGIDAVVAAYAGSRSGFDAFDRAVHAIRNGLPAARIRLLCPAETSPENANDADGIIAYPKPGASAVQDDAARGAVLRVVDALSECGARAALVFAERGVAPYAPAYLCYLAGLEYRAGFETEFGGAVLSPSLPCPKGLDDAERHVALLAAVGLIDRSGSGGSRPALPPSNHRSIACDR